MILQGNSIRIPLKDESVHVVCTSPPYWNLRDYGTASWVGGSGECDHKVRPTHNVASSTLGGGKQTTGHWQEGYKDTCLKCGATRIDNQIGLEPTIAAYIAVMVQVFREVWRVLRPDGVCWVNMGDSYATGKNGRSAADTKAVGNDDRTFRDKPFSTGGGEPARYKLRQNLTNEEMIYVLEELSKARAISEETQEGRE